MQSLSLDDPKLTPVLSAITHAGITDHKTIAQILANLHVESNGFEADEMGNVIEENLHYTPGRLLQLFPRHFSGLGEAEHVVLGGAEAIANRIYSNRMGNGYESTGDGYRYRGRGYIQITGKDNYAAATLALDYDFLSDPDAISKPKWAAKAAIWFLQKQCGMAWFNYAKEENTPMCRKLINGGMNGLDEVTELYRGYLKELI